VCASAAAVVFSPVAVLSVAVLTLVAGAMCRGVSGKERRLLLWILLVAIAIRVAAIGLLFVWSDPGHVASFPFDGDGQFLKLRSLWIRNVWLGVAIDEGQFQDAFDPYGWSSYVYVLAYVQYLFGPAPYAAHLLSVCWTISAAGMLYRLVRRSFGSAPALIALTLMLFLPTLFMWSVSATKDAWLLLLTTTVLVGAERVVRGRDWTTRVGWACAVVSAVLVLDTIRVGSLFIAVGSLAVGLAGAFATRVTWRWHALVAAVVVTALLGAIALQQPAVQDSAMARVRAAATRHVGHVETGGYFYKLVEQRFYSGDSPESMTPPEALRFMLRAVLGFVLVPLPWQAGARSQLMFIPQQWLWLLLLPLAAAGVVTAVRRDALVAWLFIGLIGVSALAIAPHEGNIGTLVRHRDGIVPFVVCLSAIGLASTLAWGGGAAAIVEGSLVAARMRGLLGAASSGPGLSIRGLWRESALASAVEELRGEEDWLWLRWSGMALLAGATASVVIAPFGELARPSWFAGGGAAVCGLFLAVCAPALERAWREKHVPSVEIDPSSRMTA
jgi:hypothetical protein